MTREQVLAALRGGSMGLCDGPLRTESVRKRIVGRVVGLLAPSFEEPTVARGSQGSAGGEQAVVRRHPARRLSVPISVRYFIVPDSGPLPHIPMRIVDGLIFHTDAIPEFADTRQRIAADVLDNEAGKPVRLTLRIGLALAHIQCARLKGVSQSAEARKWFHSYMRCDPLCIEFFFDENFRGKC